MANDIQKSASNLPATPATLVQMAIDQNADMDKLERLMAMQITWDANEAKKAYVRAMAAFSAKCPTIIKTESVSYKSTAYNHASLAGTLQQIRQLMSECGLSHSWSQNQEGGGITVTCHVTHIDGHSEHTSLTAPADDTGGKNKIQAIASTNTYLERYTLFAILGLASSDDDDGAASEPVQTITTMQIGEIDELIMELDVDRFKFLDFMKVDGLAEIPIKSYSMAIDALERKRAK